jgi:hypothetical protein
VSGKKYGNDMVICEVNAGFTSNKRKIPIGKMVCSF